MMANCTSRGQDAKEKMRSEFVISEDFLEFGYIIRAVVFGQFPVSTTFFDASLLQIGNR
jgi:hypothetical protein